MERESKERVYTDRQERNALNQVQGYFWPALVTFTREIQRRQKEKKIEDRTFRLKAKKRVTNGRKNEGERLVIKIVSLL